MTAVLGCIADDFTGGTDLAETLSRNGMRTIQLLGVPDTALASEAAAQADALVVALKIRTVPVEEAVSQALAALEALRAAGCRQFFWKYCSTFDSTPKGNIGRWRRPCSGPSAATARSCAPPSPKTGGRSIRATFSWATGCCTKPPCATTR